MLLSEYYKECGVMIIKYLGDNKMEVDDEIIDLEDLKLKMQHLREIRDELYSKSMTIAKQVEKEQQKLMQKIQLLEKLQKKVVEINEELTEKQMYYQQLKEKYEFDPLKEYDKIRISVIAKRKILKLETQIKKLEWEYETRQLSLQEERELINRLNELYDSLAKLKSSSETVDMLLKKTKEIEELKKEINKKVEIALKLVNQTSKLLEELNQIKAKIVGLSRSEREYRRQSELAHEEYMSLYDLYEQFKKKIDELPEDIPLEKRIEKENQLKEELTKAFENYKTGKGLTVDEFLLLTQEGIL